MKKSTGTKFPHIKFMLSANPVKLVVTSRMKKRRKNIQLPKLCLQEKVCITDEASVSVHIERTTLDISVNFSSSKDCWETSLRMLIHTVNSLHNPKLLSQYVLGLFHWTVFGFHEERHME
ncbi:hypothetical protein Gohar_010392 [Gossypium harknessii]|uniref:Uncharacterized protein n=1 Tax=Gossypium harknessii TaxID=34285 RepID=A0A7J9GQR1_9ROSI|nr:hypothetical protein [Gossypium harknessii]